MSQVIHHHPSILIHAFRIGVESLKVYARGEKSCRDEGSPIAGGSGGTLPQKIVKFGDSEIPFAEFFAGYLQ